MERRHLLAGLAASTLLPAAARAQINLPTAAEIEAMKAEALKALPYPRIETTSAEALTTWERLRGEGKGWPVVVGDDEDLLRIAETFSLEPDRTPAAILAAAKALTYPKTINDFAASEWGDELKHVKVGPWPKVASRDDHAASDGLSVAWDLSGKAKSKVHILLLPTTDGAEVFAYLRWGAWNSCPPPEHHVITARDWARRYGAEVIGVSGDVIDMRVQSRPKTRDEALSLAREHLTYCPDIVVQGTDTLAPLAALTMTSDWWFFWWD